MRLLIQRWLGIETIHIALNATLDELERLRTEIRTLRERLTVYKSGERNHS